MKLWESDSVKLTIARRHLESISSVVYNDCCYLHQLHLRYDVYHLKICAVSWEKNVWIWKNIYLNKYILSA